MRPISWARGRDLRALERAAHWVLMPNSVRGGSRIVKSRGQG